MGIIDNEFFVHLRNVSNHLQTLNLKPVQPRPNRGSQGTRQYLSGFFNTRQLPRKSNRGIYVAFNLQLQTQALTFNNHSSRCLLKFSSNLLDICVTFDEGFEFDLFLHSPSSAISHGLLPNCLLTQ